MATGDMWVHVDNIDAWMADPLNIKRLREIKAESLPPAYTTTYGFISADVCPTCQVPLAWIWVGAGQRELWALCKPCVRAWRWATFD